RPLPAMRLRPCDQPAVPGLSDVRLHRVGGDRLASSPEAHHNHEGEEMKKLSLLLERIRAALRGPNGPPGAPAA
ncbi:MAG: hypothetical protein ACXVZ1_04420, partial [Gaiellaceae bacterium]